MNKSDAERITKVLEKMGFVQTNNEEDAEVLGLVACSVRQKSVNKVYGRIEKWNKFKKDKKIVTFLTGCVLDDDKLKLEKLFDLVFKINELPKLDMLLSSYIKKIKTFQTNLSLKQKNFDADFWKIVPKYSSSFQAYVPIQNGCNKFCTFCAVPYTRGREISRSSDEILNEVRYLVNNGYKTITLLGQNVNSYGRDKKGEEINFVQLLQKIGEFGNNTARQFWIYYTSPHPSDMTKEVLEVMAQYPCLARHVHLPIQSGDNDILKKMNRSYNISQYRKIIKNINELLPQATIFTDIIVGFPTETRQQFENTKKAMKEFNFNMVYLACYSPRPQAVSSRWGDDITLQEKKSRFNELTEDLKKIALENNKKMIGKVCKVLIEGIARKENYLSARTEGLIPCRFLCEDRSLVGEFAEIMIESVTPFAASGKFIKVSLET